jgi:sarcosine oxidase subunit beta
MPINSDELPQTADAVVVGGGTVGAWCAYFLRQAGLDQVVLVEKGILGQGSSSRAAGVVRVQGGTPQAVRLGRWTRAFYRGQRGEFGTDSGFTQRGYLLPAFTPAEGDAAHARIAMAHGLGLPVRWLDSGEVDAVNPALAPGATLGASYCAEDGYISPPHSVAAYTAALVAAGVTVAEHTRFTGLSSTGRTVRGAQEIEAGVVILVSGPRSPRWARSPGSPSRRAGCGTTSRSPRSTRRSRTAPWCSTCRPACTGGRRKAGCCSG